MRIISGTARGRRLKSPEGRVRPLCDQAREALFNILQERVAGSSFLDLFAGSGAVGLEALSRGAKIAIFVEIDRKTVSVIRDNLELCKFSDRAEVYALEATRALKILKRKGAKFDIIFLGAPYGSPELSKAMQELSDGELLGEGAVVVAEHRKQDKIENSFGSLRLSREAIYGQTVLGFYRITNE